MGTLQTIGEWTWDAAKVIFWMGFWLGLAGPMLFAYFAPVTFMEFMSLLHQIF